MKIGSWMDKPYIIGGVSILVLWFLFGTVVADGLLPVLQRGVGNGSCVRAKVSDKGCCSQFVALNEFAKPVYKLTRLPSTVMNFLFGTFSEDTKRCGDCPSPPSAVKENGRCVLAPSSDSFAVRGLSCNANQDRAIFWLKTGPYSITSPDTAHVVLYEKFGSPRVEKKEIDWSSYSFNQPGTLDRINISFETSLTNNKEYRIRIEFPEFDENIIVGSCRPE